VESQARDQLDRKIDDFETRLGGSATMNAETKTLVSHMVAR
jgi:hypothetical protein